MRAAPVRGSMDLGRAPIDAAEFSDLLAEAAAAGGRRR